MRFSNPEFLQLLWTLPAIGIFFCWSFRNRRKRLETFSSLSAGLTKEFSKAKAIVRSLWLLGFFAFAILAAARPQWGTKSDAVRRSGIDLLIALDASYSMDAEDIAPSRFEKARGGIRALINSAQGDRMGLIIFSGSAIVQCPLTLDYSAMELFVDAAETGMSPRQGTSLASAIKQAAGSFSKQDNRYKALVIFSDGEDLSGGMEDAMRTAQEAGIAVHSIAVGTAQGAAIPIKNEKGEKTGLRTDPEGKTVVSRLNEKTLTAISNATGGRSFRATPSGSEIESLRAFISGVGKNELESKLFREYEDRFQIPLAAAILCIIAALWISEKRGQKRARRGKSELSKAAFLIVIITASASAAFSESIAVKNKRGNMLFAEGKFKDAEKAYLEALVNAPNSKKPEILYNMGNSRLKQGRREEGMQDLRSAAETGDRELQQKCWHNIGNGLFEIGNYKEAAEAYIRSLKLNPQDRDTKHNLEAALMQLSQQKEKEPEKSSGNPNGNPIKNSSFDKDQGMKLLDVMQANELDEQRKAAKRSAERPFEKDW